MKILVLFALLFISGIVNSQIVNQNPRIDNINISYDGSKIIVYYDILNSRSQDEYFVDIVFQRNAEKNSNMNAKSLTGDIGVVNGGLQKKILWDFKSDSIFFNESVFVTIKAQPKINVNIYSHLGKSLLFPGLGDLKLRDSFLPLSYGIIGYGSIVSSILLNRKAIDSYNSYLETNDPQLVDKYFNSAKLNNNLSYLFAGIAVTSWLTDIAGIIIRYNRLEKHTLQNTNNYYYIESQKNQIIAISDEKYINTTGVVKPPYLKVRQTSLKFTDEDGNNCLNAGEKAVIELSLVNLGEGMANNVIVNVSSKQEIRGLSYEKKIIIGDLEMNKEALILIPLSAEMNIVTSDITLDIQIVEALKFNPDPVTISFKTKAYVPPQIVIADRNFTIENGGKAEKGKITTLELIVQNIGQGKGEKISVSFVLPDDVIEIGDRVYYIDEMAPNENKVIRFEFVAKKVFAQNEVTILTKLNEKNGKYAVENNEFVLKFDKVLDNTDITISPDLSETEITKGSFKSDIDKDIPEAKQKNPNLYVLIIGNEDYKSFQTGLEKEVNVEYALNDAKTFYNYATKTLGALDKNVELVLNGTSGQINQMITKFNTIAELIGEDAEIIVYYAGHGLPDEKTKEPYIMPVDVSGANLSNAISLDYLFQKLTEFPTKRVTVILDACFSGGARNQSLYASRSVRVEPESGTILGNLVVFSSSSGNESSNCYDDKFHGLFTYYFLSKLKETKGIITYGEMADYLQETVKKESVIINDKIQTPNVQYSSELQNKWEKWKFSE